MSELETELCPRCKAQEYTPYHAPAPVPMVAPSFPALSRTDDKTYICSDCGNDEAIKDFCREHLAEPEEWPVSGLPWQ